MIRNRILLLVLIWAAALHARAQTWKDTADRIEKVLAQYKPGNPGYEISISRGSKVIFSKAVGMADLEHGVKMTTHTITEAGSVSKQFTAAAILLLQQQGKLSLDDGVRKYLPELPACYAPVKLRNMLHHTSGIRDWGNIAALTGWPRGTKAFTNEDVLYILSRQQALNNRPGDEFIYSNSNYNLFAIIVQRVSGMSLAAFTKKYIFEPAGMNNTSWRDDYKNVVRNRAIAYSKNSVGYYTDMPGESAYGNGGLLTTTEDLLKWQQYYLSGKLGGPLLLSQQITPDTLNNNSANNYAAGLFISKVRGWDNIAHSGSTAGYRTYLESFPQLKLSIAFLSNTSEFDTDAIQVEIENVLVKDRAKNKPVRRVTVTPGSLQRLSGLYRNDRWGDPLHISVHGDTLVSDFDGPLTPLSDHDFRTRSAELVFHENGLNYIISADTIRFSRTMPARVANQDFMGQYYSAEAQTTVAIFLNNGVLTLRLSPQQEYTLAPAYEDALVVKNFGVNLLFERDPGGKLTGMKASGYRARNIKFVKLNND